MVSKRPSLPLGYSFDGLPEIQSVLHSDECLELYSLKSSTDGLICALVIVRLLTGSFDREELSNWWSRQPSELLNVERLFDSERSPAGALVAVMTLHGHQIESESLNQASQAELTDLFVDLVELVERTCAFGMYPDLNPSLLWREPGADGYSQSCQVTEGLVTSRNKSALWLGHSFGMPQGSNSGRAPRLRRAFSSGLNLRERRLLRRLTAAWHHRLIDLEFPLGLG